MLSSSDDRLQPEAAAAKEWLRVGAPEPDVQRKDRWRFASAVNSGWRAFPPAGRGPTS